MYFSPTISLKGVSKRFEKNAQPHGSQCDQRGLGMLPQQAARWQLLAIGALLAISIMGPLCPACDERKDIIHAIFKSDRSIKNRKVFMNRFGLQVADSAIRWYNVQENIYSIPYNGPHVKTTSKKILVNGRFVRRRQAALKSSSAKVP